MKFEKTLRDFANAKPGKDFLRAQFDFSLFAPPSATAAIPFPPGVNASLVGSAFELLLLLVIFRKNNYGAGHRRILTSVFTPNEIRSYERSGTASDSLLNRTITLGIARQSAFSARNGARPNAETRAALRTLEKLADLLEWRCNRLSYAAKLAHSVRVDFILDDSLLEIKTVKDYAHHSENVAQLLAYYLAAHLPLKEKSETKFEKIGIYYSRHGILSVTSASDILISNPKSIGQIAREFFYAFIQWKVEQRWLTFPEQRKQEYLSRDLQREHRFLNMILSSESK